ncbi:MAG: MBL fold metallo-hydrolase [Ignavibacteriales bacterium]|nr:MBL fold metallo-hydrolase [Ignavibacteriales bacterium]
MNQIFLSLIFTSWKWERSGDAISLRHGVKDETHIISQEVIVIDGGTKESGESLVEHIKTFYNTSSVSHVINTHPDIDHASGLSIVLENLSVGRLWLHQPWNYAEYLKDKFKDVRWTTEGLAKKLKDSYPFAYSLEEIAKIKKIPISQPFQGSRIGPFTVLSPTELWYLELVPEFDNTPEARQKKRETKFRSFIASIKQWIDENWDIETLSEDGVTSATNESSAVLYTNIDNVKILLTADAGIDALNLSTEYTNSLGIALNNCNIYQMPHHGSRNNVNPTTLNRILGPKIGIQSARTKYAMVSSSKVSETHPRKIVCNAFLRRGVSVFSTNGLNLSKSHNIDVRPNWHSATALPFYDQVEK